MFSGVYDGRKCLIYLEVAINTRNMGNYSNLVRSCCAGELVGSSIYLFIILCFSGKILWPIA